jgi:hypothetical protein
MNNEQRVKIEVMMCEGTRCGRAQPSAITWRPGLFLPRK